MSIFHVTIQSALFQIAVKAVYLRRHCHVNLPRQLLIPGRSQAFLSLFTVRLILTSDNDRGCLSVNYYILGEFLTIIPRARMGYESIAHEAEGRMGY